MSLSLSILISSVIFLSIISIVAMVLILKYTKLSIYHNKLSKYLYNYLNVVTSARYGNLNSKCDDGVDALTIQLSRNTNALLESIYDRDQMINEYIQKEKHAQNIKQDFISSLAHDLKVPIIAQDNTYDLILNGNFGDISIEQANVIKNLKISNNDLKNLIMDLLDAHKIDKSELVAELSSIDLNNLILEVIEQNRSILLIKNKEIEFISNVKECVCKLDSFLIKRMLNNLISNAIFYGKNTKDIQIVLNKKEDELQLSVIDEGGGIKEENINKIFKKYYTSAKKYSNIGIGLGLYIVNKIVLAHKGKIEAKNIENKGACFCVTLPFVE